MVLKDSIEEMFPKWPGEPDDPQLVSLITYIHAGRFVKGFWEAHGNTQGNAHGKENEKKKKMKGGVLSEVEPPTKKQKKVKTQNESEVAAAGKGSSEKEGTKDLELENKATLRTIVSALDNICSKFEQFDSRLEAYELDRNIPLMDQKTIDDSVKALLEQRLKVLGVWKIPENNDNPFLLSADKSLTLASPRVQTQQNSVNSPALAATPGKVFGPKKNLAKELDKESEVKRTLAEEFGSVSKANDLDCQHVDFVLVSPSKATKDDKDAKVPAYGRGCRAESKNREVTPSGEDSVFADVTGEVVGEENEFASESDVENQEVIRSAVEISPKPPAPADKPTVLSADHEGDFYCILIHERPWPEKEYGWVFDNVAGCNDEYASSLKLDSQIPQRRRRIKADVKSIEETTTKVVVGLVRTGR
ncbi:hypothetical protein Bca52824_089029 [Brassica carinata]|uniref:Uncharacterized protein n=1 Tax=Brassica carinata TaxID=52824 RepID=A0A8X7PCJ2_BRACI|nr:hypothetical protein Bca52824_089029 [Brassica carinata]